MPSWNNFSRCCVVSLQQVVLYFNLNIEYAWTKFTFLISLSLQISDIHISKYRDNQRVKDLKRFCNENIDVIKPVTVLATGTEVLAKLQNTWPLWSASLTWVRRLWRLRHNTIDAIFIQWHVNEWPGILQLLWSFILGFYSITGFDILCMLKIVAAIGSYNPLNIYAHVQLV